MRETWNCLRSRIAGDHPRRRPLNDVFISLDKEFKRLAKALFTQQLSLKSYDIIQFEPIDFSRGYITVRSAQGHCVRIYLSDADWFMDWAYGDAPDKEVQVRKVLRIGNRDYDTYETDKEGNKVL